MAEGIRGVAASVPGWMMGANALYAPILPAIEFAWGVWSGERYADVAAPQCTSGFHIENRPLGLNFQIQTCSE